MGSLVWYEIAEIYKQVPARHRILDLFAFHSSRRGECGPSGVFDELTRFTTSQDWIFWAIGKDTTTEYLANVSVGRAAQKSNHVVNGHHCTCVGGVTWTDSKESCYEPVQTVNLALDYLS